MSGDRSRAVGYRDWLRTVRVNADSGQRVAAQYLLANVDILTWGWRRNNTVSRHPGWGDTVAAAATFIKRHLS